MSPLNLCAVESWTHFGNPVLDYKDVLNMRYFLYILAPASSINELIDSLSSRVQPSSR